MAANKNEIILNVNTGYKTVKIRDGDEIIGEFKFNPADSNIVTRIDDVINFFNSVEFGAELTEEQKFEQTKKLCTDICEQFDYLFGRKVSDGVFAACGPLSVTEDGDFFFETILEKISEVIEQTMGARIDKKLKKVKKAVGKYVPDGFEYKPTAKN